MTDEKGAAVGQSTSSVYLIKCLTSVVNNGSRRVESTQISIRELLADTAIQTTATSDV